MSSRLTYIPCEAKTERCLVYVTKGDQVAGRMLERAFGKAWYHSVSLAFGCDSGENGGRALEALAAPAQRCKRMYVLADLSWRGLLTASRAVKLCRPGRAVYVGINDNWFSLADETWGENRYRVPVCAEDLRARLTVAQRASILRQLGIGPVSRGILAGGQEVHLEAYCHEARAKGVRRLLRARF